MSRNAPVDLAENGPDKVDDLVEIAPVIDQALGDDQMRQGPTTPEITGLVFLAVTIAHEVHVHGARQFIDFGFPKLVGIADDRLNGPRQTRIVPDLFPRRAFVDLRKRLPVRRTDIARYEPLEI